MSNTSRQPTEISDMTNSENLNNPQKLLKNIGQVASTVAALAFVVIQMNNNEPGGSVWMDVVSGVWLLSLAVGILAFVGMMVYSVGKQQGHSTGIGALTAILKKVFLYIFLPSFLITAALWVLFLR